MKRSFLFLLLLIATTYSCELLDPNGGGVITIDGLEGESTVTFNVSPCDDGVDMNAGDLPQTILDYLNDRFPNASIDDIEIFQEEGTTAIGIRLDNDVEILFDLDGLVISGSDDDDEVNINLADLPAGLADYIATNFPGLTIHHAETELEYGETYIEIYLSDDTELYFDLDGNFLCRDDHGSDDNDWDDNGRDDDDDDRGGHDDDGPDDNNVPLTSVPPSIPDYVTANYPDYSIDEVKIEDLCNDRKVYEVELERANESNEPDLYFDLDGNFLFVETDISINNLPDAIIAALEAAYPDATIDSDDVERHDYPDGTIQYEVKLNRLDDDFEVVLAPNGDIVCVDDSRHSGNDDHSGDDDRSGDDNSGSDDDDSISLGSLPASVRDYVAANYPGYNIKEAKKDDLCNDQKVYEVELERENDRNEPDLYFDLDWNFLFAETDISVSDLPEAVSDAIEAAYPNGRIEADDVERHDYPDGSVQYKVEIESGDDDVKLVLAADGTILCRD